MESLHENEVPSGRWTAVELGARLLETVIDRLAAGGDLELALEDLRSACRLVKGASLRPASTPRLALAEARELLAHIAARCGRKAGLP